MQQFILSVSVSAMQIGLSAMQIGLSAPFSRFHKYVLIQDICSSLSDLEMEPRSPTSQADSLPAELQGKPFYFKVLFNKICSVNIFLWDDFSLPKVLYWSQKHINCFFVVVISMFYFSKYEDHKKLHEE